MLVTDFCRSFVRFRIDLKLMQPKTVSQAPPFTLNNARFTLECFCRVTRGTADQVRTTDYILSSSCKAEQVHVTENIWHEPAADMCLVASADEFLVIKSWDRNNRGVMLNPPSLGPQPERQAGRIVDAFTDLRLDRLTTTGQPLTTTEQIVEAVFQNRLLVSQSEFTLPDGTQVLVEFPVKVINVSEREMFYQVDTGPVLVPDESSYDGRHDISRMRLAFIAHNTLGCTELLLNVPTPLNSELSVNHYSRVLKVTSTNRMFAV